jgi:hypothetical protein
MQRLKDFLHELRIDYARMRFLRWPTKKNGNQFMAHLRARSPSQVARMEKAQFGSNGQRIASRAGANPTCSGTPDPIHGGMRGGK